MYQSTPGYILQITIIYDNYFETGKWLYTAEIVRVSTDDGILH